MKTRSELKAIAKQSLKGKTGTAIGAMLLYAIISMVPFCGPAGMVGYAGFNAKLTRGEEVTAGEVGNGFNLFGKALWLYIITEFFIFLWMLLLIIPAYIKLFAYSMAPYILADNPEMTARQALTASKEMMKGKKGNLFVLMLSFILWIFLMVITLGIAGFWIMPYIYATMGAFYNDNK